jgi:transcriptional regulator with XRE-family HTH domain
MNDYQALRAVILARRSLPPPGVCRDLRVDARLTQLEVASVVGVDRASVSRWESGSRRPRGPRRDRYLAVLKTLARILGEDHGET